MAKLLKEYIDALDDPIKFDSKGWLKKDKIRIIIINEDQSANTYYKKLPPSYFWQIKNKSYFCVAKCFINMKPPLIFYFYNNPFPIYLDYIQSPISALDLRSSDQLSRLTDSEKITLKNIQMDAESINLAFNAAIMRGLYGKSAFTVKSLIIILIIVAVVIFVILQATGTVDIIGMFTGRKG